jgi:hypothetical protein
MRRVTVLSGLVLIGGLLGPSAAFADEDDDGGQHRWIAVEADFAIVLPNGDTFTDEDPPPDEEMDPPTGARLFISETLYDTDDGETRGDEVGRSHIECTAQVNPSTAFVCDGVFDIDDEGQLHGTVLIDFAEEDPEEQTTFDIAVTGGTGSFFGATGEVAFTDTTEDPEDEVTALYETDIETAR